jgi:hypothetical protein
VSRASANATLGQDELAVKDYDAVLADAAPGVPLYILPIDRRRRLDDLSAPGEGRARFYRMFTALRQFSNLLHIRFGIACDHVLRRKQLRLRSSRPKSVPSATDWDTAIG